MYLILFVLAITPQKAKNVAQLFHLIVPHAIHQSDSQVISQSIN